MNPDHDRTLQPGGKWNIILKYRCDYLRINGAMHLHTLII